MRPRAFPLVIFLLAACGDEPSSETSNLVDPAPAAATSCEALPCDDCQACALESACAPLLQACAQSADDACRDLNDCSLACDPDDDACLEGCRARFPGGVEPLGELLACVFCSVCPESCSIPAADCG